ncbi:hypothetical protein H4R20_005715 [Coemansia guatemalensis]|uniref:Uncharacterized protein n=1 Tax=Coemansia guatemalensis TaxID=2761395 RepID=A0A9W8HTQ7_9FUNG|nr:hypothetical protein H4R20_005715 [Coemansia guatemalensis]
MAGPLAAWAGTWSPESDIPGSSAFFTIIASLPGWISGLTLVLTTSLSCCAIDTCQTAMFSSLYDLVEQKVNVWTVRAVVVLLNVPVIILAMRAPDILQVYLLADLLACATILPVLAGLVRRLNFIHWVDAFVGCFGGIIAVGAFGQAYLGNRHDGWRLLLLDGGLYVNDERVLGAFCFAPLGSVGFVPEYANDATAPDEAHNVGDSDTEVATSGLDAGSTVDATKELPESEPPADTTESTEEPSTSTGKDASHTDEPHPADPEPESNDVTTEPDTLNPHPSDSTVEDPSTTPQSTPDAEPTTPVSHPSHRPSDNSSPTSAPHLPKTTSPTNTGGSTKPAPSSGGKHTVVDIVTVVVDGETLTSLETSVVNDDSSAADPTDGEDSGNVPYTSTFIEEGSAVVVTGVMRDPKSDTSKASPALRYNSDQAAVASVLGVAVAMAMVMLV